MSNTPLSASLVLTNGVALGISGAKGFDIQFGGNVYSEGKPKRLNRVVHLQNVQEQAEATGTGSFLGGMTGAGTVLRFRFSDLSLRQGGRGTLKDAAHLPFAELLFKDSWLRGITLTLYTSSGYPALLGLTNNLLERSYVYVYKGPYHSNQDTPLSIAVYNNIVRGGSMGFSYYQGVSNPYWYIRDNLFDGVSAAFDSDTTGHYSSFRSHNGFTSGTPNNLGGNNNKTGLTPEFVLGPLGPLYYNDSWTNLVNAGSRTGGAAGLYHYTTQISQGKEGGSQVDIGFHYVETDPFGEPLDADGDGLPNYYEDTNGDGNLDTGETDPGNAMDVLRVKITKPAGHNIP